MRWILIAPLLGFAIVLSGCDPSPNITYDNQTGYLLCAVDSGRGPPKATPERCDEIEPNERQSYLTSVCSGDDPLWILMTVGPGGEEIYGPKLATCEEWDGATVTIQLRGDEFVVTDSLPDNTPSP